LRQIKLRLIALVPFFIATWMLVDARYGGEFPQMGVSGVIEVILNFLPLYIFVAIDIFRRSESTLFIAMARASFYIYLLSVLYLTIFFVPFRDISFTGWFNYQYNMMVNLIPFNILKDYQITDRQIMGNLIMLAPLGVYFPLLFPKINTLRGAALRFATIALSIEFIQFFFSYVVSYGQLGYGRSVDIDDFILNLSGACIGFMFSQSIVSRLKSKKTVGRHLGRV